MPEKWLASKRLPSAKKIDSVRKYLKKDLVLLPTPNSMDRLTKIPVLADKIRRAFWEYLASVDCSAMKDGLCHFEQAVRPCLPDNCPFVANFTKILQELGPKPYSEDEARQTIFDFYHPDCGHNNFDSVQDREYCEFLEELEEEDTDCRYENCPIAAFIISEIRE